MYALQDHNVWGLFLHFLSDVFTSALVLVVGILYRALPSASW